MDRLQNMSVPSRSTVTAVVDPVDKVLVLDPRTIESKLSVYNCKSLLDKINKYIKTNPKWDENITKPKSFMVSLNNESNIDMLHDSEKCEDINLIIYIMSKTYGNLYIPNKNPVYESDMFDRTLYFIKDEVFNG